MQFSVNRVVEILRATPQRVRALLASESGVNSVETDSSKTEWQPFDVVGHLIHGEVTDWVPRARIILEQGENRTFEPFDRFAQFELSKGKTLEELLDEFERLRATNIETLRSWELTDEHLALEGLHPELGQVTLRQLLATSRPEPHPSDRDCDGKTI